MIQLVPAQVDINYLKKWNSEQYSDFVHVYTNGKKINNILYRVGGFGFDLKRKYFLLLKYVEAFYGDTITTDKKRKPHLMGLWCVFNQDGIEKITFKDFESPYLHGDQIYSLNNKYYNIETGEFYCESYHSWDTEIFIFLNNAYDYDKSKRGVIKINKNDGAWELFQ